jgi:hypothetical protein
MASPSEAPTPRMVTSGGRSGRAIISIISVERAEVFGLIRRMHGIGLFVLREGSCLRLSRCGRSGCRLCRQRLFAHICSGLYRASKRSPTRGRSPVPESGSLGSVRGARQRASLVRCGLFGEDNISSSSKESGEPYASLRSKSLCGRYGPASPSSAVHAGRYPGTRLAADPVYKVARRGALPCSSPEMVARSE